MKSMFFAMTAVTAILVGPAGAAHAALPAATYRATGDVYSADFNSPYYGGNFRLLTPGTVSRLSTSAAMGSAPSPYVELHMSLVGDEYTAGERATVTYSFEVTGPDDVLVPLKGFVVAYSTVNNTGGDAFGQYLVSVVAPGGSGFQVGNGGGTYGDPQGVHDSFNGSVDFSVMANQVNTVTLFASGYVNGTSSGHVDIYADPVFSFAAPTPGYSLSFSEGIGNASPTGVPEPASWALMLIGFGGLGALMRHRRAQIAA